MLNVKPNIAFICTKLPSKFNVKYPVLFTEKHGVTYRSVCVTENCKVI